MTEITKKLAKMLQWTRRQTQSVLTTAQVTKYKYKYYNSTI